MRLLFYFSFLLFQNIFAINSAFTKSSNDFSKKVSNGSWIKHLEVQVNSLKKTFDGVFGVYVKDILSQEKPSL